MTLRVTEPQETRGELGHNTTDGPSSRVRIVNHKGLYGNFSDRYLQVKIAIKIQHNCEVVLSV